MRYADAFGAPLPRPYEKSEWKRAEYKHKPDHFF